MDERRDSGHGAERRPTMSDARHETAADTRPDIPADLSPGLSPGTPEGLSSGTPAAVPPGTAAAVLSVDTLLAAVRTGAEVGSEGEARAVAAFRAAREKGARTARTRRRDDWRPNARRRVQLSIRTTLAVLLASLTLGGVAFAAIGSAVRDDGGADGNRSGQDRRSSRDGAPARSGPSDVPHAPDTGIDTDTAPGDPPAESGDTEAHCRACAKTNEGRADKADKIDKADKRDKADKADKVRKEGKADRSADEVTPPQGSTPANKSTPSSEPKPSEEPSETGRSTVSDESDQSGSSGGRPERPGAGRGTK
ncbi:hypothetical protein [Streptomyces sp. NPDC012510]|uniref:hypothetical protein n=1 Tax=Streptomyces sp. NPDC012510 TaxID=3364838 RepID=UPI0036EB3A52